MPIAQAQETHSSSQFIGYAQNEINNFNSNAEQYWFNLSRPVLHDSFSGIQEARSLIGLAQSFVGKNESEARFWAAEAAFFAKRANYLIFVNLAASVLRDANRTVYVTIPSYIARPTDAVGNLNLAIQLNRTAVTETGFIPEDPERTWQVLESMQRSMNQLWSDKDSVANLARLAKKEALDYLALQEPIKQQEIGAEFGSLRFRSTLLVLIPITLALIVAGPTFFMLRRRFSGWLAGWQD
jgi:hypothetical protein